MQRTSHILSSYLHVVKGWVESLQTETGEGEVTWTIAVGEC